MLPSLSTTHTDRPSGVMAAPHSASGDPGTFTTSGAAWSDTSQTFTDVIDWSLVMSCSPSGEESRGGPAVNELSRALQLLAGRSAPGRLALGGHHDEAHEELAHLSSVCVVERQVELLGARRDRPLDPAQRTVGGE